MKLCGLDFETANFCNGSICAVGAALIKTGAPCRSERVAKYNRLLRIESSLNCAGQFGFDEMPTASAKETGSC